jgi:hypothetical protein
LKFASSPAVITHADMCSWERGEEEKAGLDLRVLMRVVPGIQ